MRFIKMHTIRLTRMQSRSKEISDKKKTRMETIQIPTPEELALIQGDPEKIMLKESDWEFWRWYRVQLHVARNNALFLAAIVLIAWVLYAQFGYPPPPWVAVILVLLLFPTAYHTRFLLLCLSRMLRHLQVFLHLNPLMRQAIEQIHAKSMLEMERKFDDALRETLEKNRE
jgi:hypothetical protein